MAEPTARTTRSRRVVAALATTTLMLAGCSSAQPESAPLASPPTPVPSTAADDLPVGPVAEWEPCDGDFECATVDVPRDHDDPAGATVEVALLRVPANDPDRRIGSLFVNPGGPGASGIDYAKAADRIVSPDVRAVYDVVGFDPRGVGRSTPVECLSDAELDASFSEGDPTPDSPDEVADLVAGSAEFREGCVRLSNELLPYVGTVDVARDLDTLRAAVGDDRLTYLGKSYGTSIGLEYLRRYPDRAGRLVLDGVVDPTLSAQAFSLGQAEGFDLALSRFVDACLGAGCALGGTPAEVEASIAAVLDSTDNAPLPTSGRPLTQSLAFYGIVAPLYWPPEQGYPLLEEALVQALAGDGTALLRLADSYLQREPDGSYPTNQWDVFTPVSCLDRPSDATPSDVEAVLPEFTEASALFGDALAWGLLGCTDWPVPSDGLPGPVQAPDAPPVLVLGTTGDPATPYAWAESVAAQLDTGVLVTFDATPHTAYRKGSTCVDSAVDAYLLDGDVPDDGLRCT